MKEQAEKEAAKLEAKKKAEAEMAANPKSSLNLIYPVYKFDERLKVDREVDIPPANLFFELCYNRTKEDNIKHYRRLYTNELELIPEVMPASPFMIEQAYRMEQKNAGFFGGGDDDSENNVAVPTGKFKGLVAMYNEYRRAVREKKLAEEI